MSAAERRNYVLDMAMLHRGAMLLSQEEQDKVRGIMLAVRDACQSAQAEELTAQIAVNLGLFAYQHELTKGKGKE